MPDDEISLVLHRVRTTYYLVTAPFDALAEHDLEPRVARAAALAAAEWAVEFDDAQVLGVADTGLQLTTWARQGGGGERQALAMVRRLIRRPADESRTEKRADAGEAAIVRVLTALFADVPEQLAAFDRAPGGEKSTAGQALRNTVEAVLDLLPPSNARSESPRATADARPVRPGDIACARTTSS